jgi:2-polyprenyl-3-methyl-5-hydroxy-6-metoxy-1,4-benzoquinol methylase
VSTYVFDAGWQKERDRLHALESLFDGMSTRHLADLGVTEGWQCLEVGCGAGGVALWLAEHVGRTGRVVATDLDTRFIDGHGQANLDIREHNILTDALEEDSFDLAHARAVIEHIPDHQRALACVISAVRPGGWLLIEDVDFGGAMAAALSRYFCPSEHARLAERMYRAVEAVFAAVGADASFGTQLPRALKTAGLENVGGEVHTSVVSGGAENWARGTIEQLAARLADTGLVTADDVELFLALTADRANHYAPPFMATAWGQRPTV